MRRRKVKERKRRKNDNEGIRPKRLQSEVGFLASRALFIFILFPFLIYLKFIAWYHARNYTRVYLLLQNQQGNNYLD